MFPDFFEWCDSNALRIDQFYDQCVYMVKLYLESNSEKYPHIQFNTIDSITMQYDEKRNYYYYKFSSGGLQMIRMDSCKLLFNGSVFSIIMETDDGIKEFIPEKRKKNISIFLLCARRKYPHTTTTLEKYFENFIFY